MSVAAEIYKSASTSDKHTKKGGGDIKTKRPPVIPLYVKKHIYCTPQATCDITLKERRGIKLECVGSNSLLFFCYIKKGSLTRRTKKK